MSRLADLADRLRPRSDEGDVYRNEWVEYFELIMDAFGAVLAIYAVVSSLIRGDWLVALWYPAAVVGMLVVARLVFFRPHLVVGPDIVVLVGVLSTRRIELYQVRQAVAVDGGVRLDLIGGTRVAAPGLSWKHTRGAEYAELARTINRRIEERFPPAGDGPRPAP